MRTSGDVTPSPPQRDNQQQRRHRRRYYGRPLALVALTFATLTATCDAYNLSPRPNLAMRQPEIAAEQAKVRSAYFGFSLNMRPGGIIIGAPRAQSTLEAQRKNNETGAIYKCSIIDGNCLPYVFDWNGNINSEDNEYTYESQRRDHQWLGAAMDGGIADSDKLVVCAPRMIATAPHDYLLHGVCYWTPNTLDDDRPLTVKKIAPFKLKTEQIKEKDGQRFYYYMLAELGISAHISANGQDILMGAPGIHTWKGSVVRYYEKLRNDDPSLSRRDVAAAAAGGRIAREFTNNNGQQQQQQQAAMGATITKEYISDVPNPDTWNQPNDSYFGYAISSGYFDETAPSRLMYVATAPQANEQSGEAYLFDIVGSTTISKHFVFRGTQFGEYFGGAILAEDLNGDGLSDVIVAAPQYSISGSYDDGAIYVFTNLGRFMFERQLVTSPLKGRARFGTALSRLGDINHDGYNDVAVGAPFADGTGTVFIYLGNGRGLREQPSQRILAPSILSSSGSSRGGGDSDGDHMFGYGLSKGADIDGNGFNDVAIGAPNADAVFVYRAYPVVKIVATVTSSSRQIKPEPTRIQLQLCYAIETTSLHIDRQELTMRLVADAQVKRVRLLPSETSELTFNEMAGRQRRCRSLDADVRFSTADIFKPLELELHYSIVHGIPTDSADFCATCAAVDPAEPRAFIEKIVFSTGCVLDICVADLRVQSSLLQSSPSMTFILGSSRTLSVRYEVTNSGETAYLPQINITSSNRMPFARVPSTCKAIETVLICDLNRGQPLLQGGHDAINIVYDVSGIGGRDMMLMAAAFSTGNESTPGDNVARDTITLREFTEIDVIGIPYTPPINLEKVSGITEVINNYEIKSMGPSTIPEMEITFNIPVAYRVATSSSFIIPIVSMDDIAIQAVYDGQLINVEFYQNFTQLIMNAIVVGTTKVTTTTTTTLATTGAIDDEHNDDDEMATTTTLQQNAAIIDEEMKTTTTPPPPPPPPPSQASINTVHSRHGRHVATQEQYAFIAQTKPHDDLLLGDDLKGMLPVNRTIVFNCGDRNEMTMCVRAVMKVYGYRPEKPITVALRYHVDLHEVNQILVEPWEFFVIAVGVNVMKTGGEGDADVDASSSSSLHVHRRLEYNIISKHQLYGTPVWVYILAVLGGLLALALITYGMYKAGFFERTKKDQMDKMVNRSQNGGGDDDGTETDNLNSDGS